MRERFHVLRLPAISKIASKLPWLCGNRAAHSAIVDSEHKLDILHGVGNEIKLCSGVQRALSYKFVKPFQGCYLTNVDPTM